MVGEDDIGASRCQGDGGGIGRRHGRDTNQQTLGRTNLPTGGHCTGTCMPPSDRRVQERIPEFSWDTLTPRNAHTPLRQYGRWHWCARDHAYATHAHRKCTCLTVMRAPAAMGHSSTRARAPLGLVPPPPPTLCAVGASKCAEAHRWLSAVGVAGAVWWRSHAKVFGMSLLVVVACP